MIPAEKKIFRNTFKRRFRRVVRIDERRAILGDENGRVHVVADKSKVWVREITSNPDGTGSDYGKAFPVIYDGAAMEMQPGAGVFIQHDPFYGQSRITRTDATVQQQQGRSTLHLNAGNPQKNFFTTAGYQPLLVKAVGTGNTPSTKVAAYGSYVIRGTTISLFVGEQLDLASSIPTANNHCLALVALKTDDTLEVATSTTQNILDLFDVTDLQEALTGLSADSIPLKYFRLADAQTSITDKDEYDDARQLINTSSSSSEAFPEPITGTYTVASGTSLVVSNVQIDSGGELVVNGSLYIV